MIELMPQYVSEHGSTTTDVSLQGVVPVMLPTSILAQSWLSSHAARATEVAPASVSIAATVRCQGGCRARSAPDPSRPCTCTCN